MRSITSLSYLRESDTCIICGNGPSLLKGSVFKTSYDKFLINTGVFLAVDPTIVFIERIGIISSVTNHSLGDKMYLSDNFDYEVLNRVILYAMSSCCEQLDGHRIYINPNQSSLGYLNPLASDRSYIELPIYSFNEDLPILYGLGLLEYFERYRETHLLNFRGSIIRAFSTALAMGYKSIIFSGLDPSRYSYWWEYEEGQPHLTKKALALLDHFRAITKLRPTSHVKHDTEVGYFENASMTWCLKKTILAAKLVYAKKGLDFPKLSFESDDVIIRKLAESL